MVAWFVLACASLIPFGAHYMKHSLGPLKVYFVQDFGYSHAEFGGFLSASSLPNLVFPVFAGAMVDERGHDFSGLLFTSVALLGHVLFCVALTAGAPFVFGALARVLYGLGEGGTGIVQGCIVGRWVGRESLAFAIGVTESVHFTANWLGKALPAEIAASGGFLGALWFGNAFLFVSVFAAITYATYAKTEDRPFVFAFPSSHSPPSSPPPPPAPAFPSFPKASAYLQSSPRDRLHVGDHARPRSSSATFYGAVALPASEDDMDVEEGGETFGPLSKALPLGFWLVAALHLLFSNCSNLFGGFSADFIGSSSSTALSPSQAGLLASVDSLLPIFLAPAVGHFVDRVGGRVYICALAALANSAAFALLRFTADVTPSVVLAAMLLMSLSTSATPTLIKSAVPAIVPHAALGYAFGIYGIFESLGGTIGHVLFGYVRDVSESYDDDLQTLLVLSLISFAIALATLWLAPALNH